MISMDALYVYMFNSTSSHYDKVVSYNTLKFDTVPWSMITGNSSINLEKS